MKTTSRFSLNVDGLNQVVNIHTLKLENATFQKPENPIESLQKRQKSSILLSIQYLQLIKPIRQASGSSRSLRGIRTKYKVCDGFYNFASRADHFTDEQDQQLRRKHEKRVRG